MFGSAITITKAEESLIATFDENGAITKIEYEIALIYAYMGIEIDMETKNVVIYSDEVGTIEAPLV